MITSHPRYAALRALTDSLVKTVSNRQAEYLLWRGYYFHGPRIPSEGQLSGEGDSAIPYGKRPEGRPDSWADFDSGRFNASSKLPFHVALTPYAGPEGHGWVLTVDLFFAGIGPDAYGQDGDHWVYRHHEGPERRVGIWDEWYIEGLI